MCPPQFLKCILFLLNGQSWAGKETRFNIPIDEHVLLRLRVPAWEILGVFSLGGWVDPEKDEIWEGKGLQQGRMI